jgi:hypothetical protein
MISNPSHVIVSTKDFPFHSVHSLSVHHRDFPEVRCEGGSPEDAASRLAELLSSALDSAPSDWRREILTRAIEDVRAFVKRVQAEPAGDRSALPRLSAESGG